MFSGSDKGYNNVNTSLTSSSSSPKMDRSLTSDSLDGEAAAAGSFFGSDYKSSRNMTGRFGDLVTEGIGFFLDIKHDDLKQMLDSNRDNLKLEAMKRIIGMVAKGRDASELFPAVVKNVVSKNTEVKKLVYVYLVRYAEEQQELALLSIATFQRALKDPNQLIRASALRVLSSIRVSVIVPIVMLAIRDASADMSPYVRKTAAHAIPKLYSLDPEQKEELVTIVDKLLADKTTLVVGSAMMAFDEVCPERIDLIHKNYRKLCTLLVDVDEWGQVIILHILTRYARTQFVDPNLNDLSMDGEERPFYEDLKGSDSDDEEETEKKEKKGGEMDPDHRLLLRNSRPLLQSRNAAVVMAVAQMYHHIAPKSEVHLVVKALIRLLRSHPEVQVVVLTSIAAMSTNRKSLFEPYMKSFYVRNNDPTPIKLLKLEILTNIANEANIPPILREFQAYIPSGDKEFVAATIQAIGRCASNIKEVAETCLNGLVSLLSHPDPAVVGEAVVVAKTLLQGQKSGNKQVIAQLAKMVDRVTVPPARAAILWLLGEHSDRIPNLPPDVLRKMAKTFPDEDDVVKLQIVNLACKLQLTNPAQTTLLCQYILNLAKYDQSYDIRDRARFVRHLLFPENPDSSLSKYAKKILLSSKPAPVLESKFKDRDHFQLGSLSHFLNTKAVGYADLPPFPPVAPDPTVRNVELPPSATIDYSLNHSGPTGKKKRKEKKKQGKKATFYSESEDESTTEGSGSGSGTEDSDSDSSETTSGPDDESVSGSSTASEEAPTTTKNGVAPPLDKKIVHYNNQPRVKPPKPRSSSSSSGSSSSSSGSASEASGSDSEEDSKPKKPPPSKKPESKPPKKSSKTPQESNVDLLLDFSSEVDPENKEGGVNGAFTAHPSFTGLLAPTSTSLTSPTSAPVAPKEAIESASPAYIPSKKVEILNKLSSGGLQITARFTRAPHLSSDQLISIELEMSNHGKEVLKNIGIESQKLPGGLRIEGIKRIEVLEPGKNVNVTLGIDFNDTTQGAKMEVAWINGEEAKKAQLTIKASIGEALKAVAITQNYFLAEQGKLRGMNEHDGKVCVDSGDLKGLVRRVYEAANVLQVPSTDDSILRFAGVTRSSSTLVLVSLHLESATEGGDAKSGARLVVNCDKMVIGSMLVQELKEALK